MLVRVVKIVKVKIITIIKISFRRINQLIHRDNKIRRLKLKIVKLVRLT